MTTASLPTMVVDASVSISWVLQEQPDNCAAQSLFLEGYKGRCHLLVPALWLWECGIFDAAPDVATQVATLNLAMQCGLSYYDAAYVELAQRRNAQLATYDVKMQAAARKIGIACYDLIPNTND